MGPGFMSIKLRRILVIVVLVCAAGGAYAFVHVGTFLAREDPLRKGDAIFVLAGTELTRPLEGGDLYLEGYAPRIVMSREILEPAFAILEHRGAKVSSKVERARDILTSLGVPAAAITLPDRLHANTAEEAATLRELALKNGWRTVIVVTSKYHLRRAYIAMQRQLRGTQVQVVMRGSRFDEANMERWWTQRGVIRDVVAELPRVVAYGLGLGS